MDFYPFCHIHGFTKPKPESNQAIQNLIREGKTYQIFSVLQTGRSAGMQTMEDHIKDLVQKNLVGQEEANIYLNELTKDL